jgi:hypothetical protein
MHGWGLRRWLVIAGVIAAAAAVVLIGGLAASHDESSGKDRDYAEESEAGEAGEEAEEEQSEEPLAGGSKRSGGLFRARSASRPRGRAAGTSTRWSTSPTPATRFRSPR